MGGVAAVQPVDPRAATALDAAGSGKQRSLTQTMVRTTITGCPGVRLALLLAALLVASACAGPSGMEPSPGPWRFSGTVSARDGGSIGGPIHGAQLTVISGINESLQVQSDSTGHFAFDALTGDRFNVTIEAPGYVSVTPTVHLYRDVDANFALEPR